MGLAKNVACTGQRTGAYTAVRGKTEGKKRLSSPRMGYIEINL
jgi:hypothetical protein